MVKQIGGLLLDDVKNSSTATHVIASDGKESMKRTVKLMIAMSKTPNIVTLDWLKDSAKANRPLPCDNYLVVRDRDAEDRYGFHMRETVERIKLNREQNKSFLDGVKIFICDGVAGNKAPKEDELKLIIEAAGGEYITDVSVLRKHAEPGNAFIITSADLKHSKQQISKRAVKSVLANGCIEQKSASWLFRAVLMQALPP